VNGVWHEFAFEGGQRQWRTDNFSGFCKKSTPARMVSRLTHPGFSLDTISQPFDIGDKTIALSNQWGLRSLPLIDQIISAVPSAKMSYKPAQESE